MARLLSVTVSMAAEINGMLSEIVLVNREDVLICAGRTEEKAGTSKTSSKVRASGISIRPSHRAYSLLAPLAKNLTT